MDLNDFYFRHQISLMRASGAGSAEIRARHQACADELARDIGQWQRKVGAGAVLRRDDAYAPGKMPASRQASYLDCLCS